MSRLATALLLATGALVGSVVGSGVTLTLMGPSQPSAKAVREPRAGLPKAEPLEETELERLRMRLHSLERRVSLLTFAQAHTSPTKRAAAGDGEETGVQAEPKVVDDPVFEAAVRDVVDRVEFERDAQRDVERAERRQAAADRWASSFGTKLELTDEQQARVTEIMTQHFEKLRALRDGDPQDKPVLRTEWRSRFQALRTEAEESLKRILNEDQKERYEQLDEMEKFGAFGPRRGGGRERPSPEAPR